MKLRLSLLLMFVAAICEIQQSKAQSSAHEMYDRTGRRHEGDMILIQEDKRSHQTKQDQLKIKFYETRKAN